MELLDIKRNPELIPYIIALVAALVAALILIYLAGADPAAGLYYLIGTAVGTTFGMSETLVKMTPILLASLGCMVAFKARIWNIGAEGQLYMGAITAAWIGIIAGIPGVIHPILLITLSFLAGGLYALVPAILKVKRGINEVITTIMMNYIAYWLAHYFIHWPPLRDPNAANPQTYPILPSAALPKLVFGTRLHAGFLIAIVSIFLVYILLEKTKTGYEIKITGSNPTAATYGGIKVGRVILISMLIGGGLAGLAGMGEVAGLHGYLLDDISPGYGYIAALIALFGRLNIIGVVLSAFFVSVLFNGADIMQLSLFIPRELADVIVSLMVLLIISRELFMKKGLKVR